MEGSDIEDVHPTPFLQEDWIGKGRKVPAANDTPKGLAEYFATVKEVPNVIRKKYYAESNLNIESFLKINLPTRLYTLPTISIGQCFSRNNPNERPLEILSKCALPPCQLVNKFEAHFRQAVFDGMCSMVDPAYAGSRLPLWVTRFWMEMWERHDVREQCEKGLTWLDEKIASKTGKEVAPYLEARKLTQILRWGEETNIPGANRTATHQFFTYLSESTKMNTSHINMMFSHLSDRVEQDETLDSLVAVETLRFWMEINKAASIGHFSKESPCFLGRLEKRLKKEEIDYLVFPTRLDSEEQ
jgi:hypothetical protein